MVALGAQRFAVALALLALPACADPVHDEAIAALGDEEPGVEPGPLHRPGQPCLVCHGPEGPADTRLTVAGTIYNSASDPSPAEGVAVRVRDAEGTTLEVTTNAAGNFALVADVTFPLQVELRHEDLVTRMKTSIGRDGSCAGCHLEDGDGRSMPRVYLAEEAP